MIMQEYGVVGSLYIEPYNVNDLLSICTFYWHFVYLLLTLMFCVILRKYINL